MRIGLALDDRSDVVDLAVEADRAGLAAIALAASDVASAIAASVAAATTDVRLLVPVRLGSDNPTTLAEELAVVDQISGGRVVAVVDRGALSVADAVDDLAVLVAASTGRWVDLPARWRGERPVRVAVTPAPAQLSLPIWSVRADLVGLPVVATADVSTSVLAAAPAVYTTIAGDLESDRAEMVRLASAGAALALVRTAVDVPIERYIARYLVPEAAMPHFPRVIADSAWPTEYRSADASGVQ